ncbi:MAG: hypothetical protein EOM26_11505 [Alphaproteobacteria bacterium]|nr:hypothetical protein [Alphaproteobacteria bacterium]
MNAMAPKKIALAAIPLAVLLLAAGAGFVFPGGGDTREGAVAATPVSIPGFKMITERVAISGMPGREAISALAEQGFGLVVNLCDPRELAFPEAQDVESLGMRYVNIPVDGGTGIDPAQVQAFAQALNGTSKPALVHCRSGNRAGAMWTAYRLSEGVNWDVALAEGRAAGMSASWEDLLRPYCRAC